MRQKKSSGAAQSWFLWVAPFVLPALFFQSSLFALISPLPIFIITLKNRLWISLFAIFTNAAFIFAFDKDPVSLFLPIWFWFSIGVSFPLFIRRFKKVPIAFSLSYSLALSVIVAGIMILAHGRQMEVTEYIRFELNLGIERMIAIPDHPIKKWVEEAGKPELLKNLMTELPSGVMITLIICYWFNLLLTFRTLPGFLSRVFWASYKTPEWLVWPTLACGAFYLFGEQALYLVGLNGVKVLLVFYGLQGLSIVTFVLNQRKIMGFMRMVIFSALIFFASPFVFALGFFDLWFDFRRKFRQT